MATTPAPWYLDPNFLPAAFGLMGVIVGGLITALSSYLLDERKAKRDREGQEVERLKEIKRAARMIDADFATAEACAMYALDHAVYWDAYNAPLDLGGWKEHAALLAPMLLSDAWFKVRLGIDGIRTLNTFREWDAARAGGNYKFPPLSSELKPGMATALSEIQEAREALAFLCYESIASDGIGPQ